MDRALTTTLLGGSTVAQLMLITLGISIIYVLTRVINFAHGDFLTLGAYSAVFGGSLGAHGFWLGLLVAPIIGGALGYLVHVLVIRHLGGRLIDSLLATFGISLIMAQIYVEFLGATAKTVRNPFGTIRMGDYGVSGYHIFLIVAVAVIFSALWWILTRTMFGLRVRAVLSAPEAARSSGIRSSQLNGITFALGCAVAGLAGALIAPLSAAQPFMGQAYLPQAFLTLLAGGMAVLVGTFSAGLTLGTLQFSVAQLTTSVLGNAVLLGAAVVILRFVPGGLASRFRREL